MNDKKNSVVSLLLVACLASSGSLLSKNDSNIADPSANHGGVYTEAISFEEASKEDVIEIPVEEIETPSPTESSTETIPVLQDIPAGTATGRYYSVEYNDYMDYHLFVPENATDHMPLIIFLHGDGEVDRLGTLQNFGMPRMAKAIYGENYPFIMLSPCTRTNSWTEGSIPGTLMGLIEDIVEDYKIDRDRIIIAGHSRGAIGVWYMVSAYGDYFSAAVPVSFNISGYLDYEMITKVPIRAFVGNSDEREASIADTMQNNVNLINQAGGDAELFVLNGASHGQTSNRAFTKETFQWMLEQ